MNLAGIDVNLVIALDALLRERNVTYAARRMGLSQPAMSHALTRLRELFSDPLLVRVGRQMALSPRAEAMIPQVASIMQGLAGLFGKEPPTFDPATTPRVFRIAASEYVDLLLLSKLNAALSQSGKNLSIHLLPLDARAADAIRLGDIDLAIGAFPADELPSGVRREELFEDRFIGIARTSHPTARGRLDLETYAALTHVTVPRQGAHDGVADALLAARGVQRRVVMTVAHVFLVPHVVAGSDHVATVAARIGRAFSSMLPLRTFDLPFDLPPLQISMLLSARTYKDPALVWLRGIVRDAVAHMQDTGRRKRM